MLLATEKDYQGGPIYTVYPPPSEVYAKRANLFRYYPDPILVVGCGFGGLVQELENLGKKVYGIDASPYAVENRVSKRVKQGDILCINDAVWLDFNTVITEDLLPCLTDQEALIVARNCQALAPIVVHMVTEQGEADLNYHSTGYWMILTNQLTISLEGM